MTTTDMPRPAFSFIVRDAAGRLGLVAQRCRNCGATYADSERVACGRCGAREDDLELFSPSLDGALHSAVVVRRGFPGIEMPFISAIIDLDGGPSLKGTLRNSGFELGDIRQGRRVRVCFDDALGRKDKDGNSYIAYHFEPIG